jgi:hypothetical protein
MRNRILIALIAAATTFCLQAEVWQAEYGVARVFNFKLYNADGTLDVDEVDAGTEVSLSCNEGAETTATNDFADEGNFYSISLTAAELQCERVAVVVAATTTEVFFVETFGHASAFNETLGWLTGDSFARLGDPAGASVSADIAAIEGQTDDIGAAGAGLTAIDLPNQTMDITGTLSTVTTVGTVNALGNDAIAAADVASDVGPEIMASTPTGNGPFPGLGIIDIGTAQAADTAGITLRAGFSTAASNMVGVSGYIYSSTNGLHGRCISTAYNDTSKVLSCPLDVAPTGTVLYVLYGTPEGTMTPTGIRAAVGLADADLDSQFSGLSTEIGVVEGQTDDIGVAGAGLTAIDLPNQTMDITGTLSTVSSVTALGNDAIAAADVSSDVGTEIARAVLDTAVDGALDVEEMLCYLTAVIVNQMDYNGSTEAVFDNAAGDTPKVTVTYANGDRTAITLAACGN